MAGLSLGLGYSGGAAVDELHEIIAERLMQQQLEERVRAAKAEEQNRARQMEEQQRWRELQQEQLQEEREFRRGIAENQQKLAGQAATERSANAIVDDTPIGGALSGEQAETLRKGGRSNLVRVRPRSVVPGLQTKLGGGSATIEPPVTTDEGGNEFTGTAGQIRQERTDTRLENVASNTQDLRERQLSLQQAVAEGRMSNAAMQIELARARLEAAQNKVTSAATQKSDTLREQAQNVIDTIDQLGEMPGKSSAVGLKGPSGWFGGIPGSKAGDYRRVLETLRAQLALPNLRHMRGLGQMSNKEFEVIQRSASALSADLSESQLDAELKTLKAEMAKLTSRGSGGGTPADPLGLR